MIIFLDDSVDGFFKGGTDTCNGHFDISSLESSFSDKSQKISTRTIPEHTIFGYGNQLNRNDTDPSTRGKREDCVTVPGSTGRVISLHEETKSINFASTSTVSSHAATTNFRIAGNRDYNSERNHVCGSEGRRTGLVGAESAFSQGKINNFCLSLVNNSFRRFIKKMGSFLSRAQDWRIMDIVRKQMSYVLEMKAAKFAILAFTRMHPSVQSIHLQVDNVVVFSYLVKVCGGYSQQISHRYKQRDLGLLAGQRDHNYSRIPSRCSQQGSRFPVASSERLQRMEVGSQSLSNNMQQVGTSRRRSFCFKNFPNIHMKIESIQQEKGRFSNNLGPSKRICFPPFAPIGQVLNKVQKKKATLLLITPAWQTQS